MIETQHRCRDGSLLDVEVTVHPFLHEGKFSSFSFVRDLTESKKVEFEKERAFQAMLEAKESAERASRSKDEFLAVMSHEMRTPLNPILGFANILRNECTAEQNEYISIIYESAERLRNLISEILDYIRLGKGDIEPKLAEFDLLELCQISFLDARQQFQGKPIQLTFVNGFGEHAPISQDFLVRSDSHMILRILDNLLINACKYTPSGSVHFHVGCDVRAEEPSQAQFFASVVDTGIGIGPEALQNIFDPFTQADSSYSRKSEGVGLGLSICKKLIDLLGGDISVESQPGKGSAFQVQIPLEPIKNSTTRPRHADPVEWKALPGNPIILIVDDTANNAKIAGIMVRKVGCRSETVCDGHAAIQRCSEQPFDLILMDLSMPGMDGMETTRQLRQSPGPNQKIPIVGLSAHVSHSVRQQCTDAGMDGYLEKPIQADELQETLWKHLAASQ